jgi:predicted enzyme related to lactoylglutathione lyase
MGDVAGKTKRKKTTKNKIKNFVSWFEIPVHNLARAVGFYNHIYGIELETLDLPDYSMAFFPSDNGVGGALVMGPGCIPTESGTLIYLNGGDDLTGILSRVEAAGGRIILEKSLISEDAGYFALFIDTEGNKLALHSNK